MVWCSAQACSHVSGLCFRMAISSDSLRLEMAFANEAGGIFSVSGGGILVLGHASLFILGQISSETAIRAI